MKLSIKLLSLLLVVGTTAYAADTASILPPAKTTFFDQNGKPLTNGTVDFYIPNGTTRKATWQDAGETILNTNPVVLDGAGRALILGSGSYRQVVKDRSNNLIWDQVTASPGSGGGSSPTATGDGDLVGTVKPWAGMTAPNQYMFTYGQEVSRTTYASLFTAITSAQAVFCNSGNAVVSGLIDTTNFNIGVPVELSCVVGGFTTITAKTATTVTLALIPNVTANVTATFFPWGNGNHSTTFNLPDYRGLIPIGNNNMGGVASANMSSTYFGTNPNSVGGTGGSQFTSLLTGNLPAYTPSGTIINGTILNSVTGGTKGSINTSTAVAAAGHAFADVGPDIVVNISQLPSGFTGTAQGGSSIPFSRVMPSQTTNYIVKVTPDTNSATASGVTSLGSMTGDIACGAGLLCTGNIIASSIANPVSGPLTSSIGNVAFWTDTLGKSIGATPAFISANPGNAAIYSTIAQPTSGTANLFNGLSFQMGSVIPATEQYGNDTVAVRQSLVATGVIAAGDTSLSNTLAGYCRTEAPNPAICVGLFGQSGTSVAGANLFGLNGIAQNIHAPSTAGFNVNYLAGAELNPNLWQISPGVNPTVSQSHFYGLNIQGGGNHTNEIGSAIVINNSAFPAATRWFAGIEFITGCCVQAATIQPAAAGINQPSMPIVYNAVDAGGITRTTSTFIDQNGSFYMSPPPNAAIIGLDGLGNVTFKSDANAGGSEFLVPLLTTNGVVTNTTTGLIGTLAGTTTTVLHGNAAGLPTFSAVNLTSDVTGSLPAVNGGTGQTAYVLGDTLYSPSANILFRLPGNTTAVKQYLSQTGTGAVSAAPAWATIAGADITGAALTKTDDTNVTLTLGGTPATALLRASSLTLGWTGTLAVSRGGIGIASGTSGGIPYFSGTTSIASSALLTANAIMLGGGAATAPATLGSLGTTTTLLHGNASGAPTFGAVVSADMNITSTSCTNQFVTAISTGGVGTCTTDTLASAQHANQGTTTTVLHGNAAGNPSFAAVSLTADVSGILPIANGGVDQAAWTTYSPSTASGTVGGTPATYTVNSARYKQIGKTVYVSAVVTVTNQGVGAAGDILIGLPFTASSAAAASWVGSSREYSVTGKSGFTWAAASGTTMGCRDATNTTYIVTGNSITASITYEIP